MNEKLTRQQKRDLYRKTAKDTGKLVELIDRELNILHARITILTEVVRLSGIEVSEETLKQAEENVRARVTKKEAG